MLKPSEAAKLVKRTTRTISQWAANGLITKYKDGNGGPVYLQTELEAIANELPHCGRPKVMLSEAENEDGYMTIGEAHKTWQERASYVTFYNWVKNGLLATISRPGAKVLLTKRLYVLRALKAQGKLIEAEIDELTTLEVRELRKAK